MADNKNTPDVSRILSSALSGLKGIKTGGKSQEQTPVTKVGSAREGVITNPNRIRQGLAGISKPQAASTRIGGIIGATRPNQALTQTRGTSGSLFGSASGGGSGSKGGQSSSGGSMFSQASNGAAQEQASQDYEGGKAEEGGKEGSYEYKRGEGDGVLEDNTVGNILNVQTGNKPKSDNGNKKSPSTPLDTMYHSSNEEDLEAQRNWLSQALAAVMSSPVDEGGIHIEEGAIPQAPGYTQTDYSWVDKADNNTENGEKPKEGTADAYQASATEGENENVPVDENGHPITYNGSVDVNAAWDEFRQSEGSGLSDDALSMTLGDFIINGSPEDWYAWTSAGPLAQTMYADLADYDSYDDWYNNWYLPNEAIDIVTAANAMNDDWYNTTGNNVNTWNTVLDYLNAAGYITPDNLSMYGFNADNPEDWDRYKQMADYMYGYQYGKNNNGAGWNEDDMNAIFGNLSGLEFGRGNDYTYSNGTDYLNVDPTIMNARMMFDQQGIDNYITSMYGYSPEQLDAQTYNLIKDELYNQGIMALPDQGVDYWGTGVPVQGIRNLAGAMGYGWR